MKPTASRSKPSKATRAPLPWPRKVTFGRASVTVYQRRTPAGKVGYLVANYSGGKRRLDSYPDEATALDAAAVVARRLSTGQVLAGELTNADASRLATAKATLDPLGLDLLAVAANYAEAVKVLGGDRVLEAARFFMERNPASLQVRTVREVVDELLAAKTAAGVSGRYAEDLRYRLTKFADAFACPIGTLTADTIQTWLDGLGLAPQSRVNFRRVLRLLAGFAIRRRYLPRGWDELDRLEGVKVRGGQVTIYSPEELRRLLTAAAPDFLPALALQAFCGIRSAEVLRLDWRNVKLAQGHVEVAADAAKTSARRLVPICDSLRAWLAPFANLTGPVWPLGEDCFSKRQRQTAEAAGIEWKANALRHSFISYRVALTGDVAATSLEAGNSAQMIFRHYREVVTPDAGRAWFAVQPEAPGNVVALPASAVA